MPIFLTAEPTSKPFPRLALLLTLVTWFTPGCEVKESIEAPLQCTGPNCDAGLDEPREVTNVPTTSFDSGIEIQTPSSDSAPVEICPGICLPDDPKECEGYDGSSELELRNRTLGLTPAGNADAGRTRLPREGDASVASGVVSDAADAAEFEPGADAGSPSLEVPVGSAPADDVAEGAGDLAGASPSSLPGAADAGAPSQGASRDASVELDGSLPLAPVALDAGGGDPEPVAPERYSCQLLPEGAAPTARCAPAGTVELGLACGSSRDCLPGLGCVGEPGAGRCLPYCCGGRGACGAGLFCTERPLIAPDLTEPLMVPVCAFPEQCDLGDPFPCPSGQECSCPPGKACAAVGRDGARACVEPGEGLAGEACPCAAGHFCSPEQQICLESCRFGTDSCGEGSCQGVGGFPEGWGLCVGRAEVMEGEAQ